MKQLLNSQDKLCALRSLLNIPHKILSFDEVDNISEFILHELCNDSCLKLDRAAYFVDNPDFDCFRGIAGVDRTEKIHSESIWNDPDVFTVNMRNSPFNTKVKNISRNSVKCRNHESLSVVDEIANSLSFNNHSFYTWKMKHGNDGIFLYQPGAGHNKELSELVAEAVYFLGLCPLF